MEEDSLLLLPGFRFHPTDEEIVIDYLSKKVADQSFSAIAVGEVDLNSCEPWDLPKKAKMGEKVWYFFCHKDRKYPTGTRTNRATETGYWKATGKDKEIHRGGGRGRGRVLVGMKKTLVFYTGRAPKGEKTNWVMHEFRLEASSHFGSLPQAAMESWVVCRVFHKNEGIKKTSSLGMEPEAPGVGQQFNQIHNIPNQENPSYYFGSPNSFFTHEPGSAAGSGYLHQEEATGRGFGAANDINAAGAIPSSSSAAAAAAAFIRQCKVEQLVMSNSMAIRSRHETGMSSHCHTEISSCDAKDSSHAGPLFGLENIWDY